MALRFRTICAQYDQHRYCPKGNLEETADILSNLGEIAVRPGNLDEITDRQRTVCRGLSKHYNATLTGELGTSAFCENHEISLTSMFLMVLMLFF